MFPENIPGLFIPCESLEALKDLIMVLYGTEILTDETWQAANTPANFLDILNDSSYFEKGELCGIVYRKGAGNKLNIKTDDLL
jgi:hypothetical protein